MRDLKKLDSSDDIASIFSKHELMYKFLEKKQHRIYGKIYILVETNNPDIQIAVKDIFYKNQYDFEIEVQKQKEMENRPVKNENIVSLIKYFDYTYLTMCTSFYRLITVIEYHSRDMSTELFFRKLLID